MPSRPSPNPSRSRNLRHSHSPNLNPSRNRSLRLSHSLLQPVRSTPA